LKFETSASFSETNSKIWYVIYNVMIGNRMPPDETIFAFGDALNVLTLAGGNKE